MNLHSHVAPSLGLLHIMEDTLIVVRGGRILSKRRKEVLKESREFFADAGRGKIATMGTALVIGPDRERATNCHALFAEFSAWAAACTPVKNFSAEEAKEIVATLERGEALKDQKFISFFETFCRWLNVKYPHAAGSKSGEAIFV